MMGNIPDEILAVILGAGLTLLGFLAKKALSKIEESQSEIKESLVQITGHLSDYQIDATRREDTIKAHGEMLGDHEERIGVVECWARNTTMYHNKQHPDAPLEMI